MPPSTSSSMPSASRPRHCCDRCGGACSRSCATRGCSHRSAPHEAASRGWRSMTRPAQLKLAVVSLLVGTLLLPSRSSDAFGLGLVAFGVFNVLVTPPGTFGVRVITVLVTFIMLVSPMTAGVILWLLLWIAWPPAYFVAWMLGLESDRAAAAPPTDETAATAGMPARVAVVVCIAAVALATLAYGVIVHQHLEQSAVLFVGIPSLLAIVVVMATSPR